MKFELFCLFAHKSDEETKSIREKVIALRTEAYHKLEEEIKKRQPFEEAVRGTFNQC